MQMVVVVDDEDRENEGDLIMAAQLATPEAMAFIVKHGTGIVCVSMKEEDLDRLELPMMVNSKDNDEKLRTAFTVTVVCSTFLPCILHSELIHIFLKVFIVIDLHLYNCDSLGLDQLFLQSKVTY